jgi:hypothetical protein
VSDLIKNGTLRGEITQTRKIGPVITTKTKKARKKKKENEKRKSVNNKIRG